MPLLSSNLLHDASLDVGLDEYNSDQLGIVSGSDDEFDPEVEKNDLLYLDEQLNIPILGNQKRKKFKRKVGHFKLGIINSEFLLTSSAGHPTRGVLFDLVLQIITSYFYFTINNPYLGPSNYRHDGQGQGSHEISI